MQALFLMIVVAVLDLRSSPCDVATVLLDPRTRDVR